jgi:YgiT-type zinc finger domain-containing protein
MNCVICKTGETSPSSATVTLTRGNSTVIVKEVPADICDNCGAYFLSEEISKQVMALAEQVIKQNAEVGILRFAA